MMKKTMLWSALCVLVLAACEKKPAATVAVTPPATPAPVGEAFAPAGVFFLLKKVSIETDSGIFGYAPGTKVNAVGRRYITRDGKLLTLRADQITNDLGIAQRLAGNDAAAQAAIRATRRMPPAPPAAPAPAQSVATVE